MAWTPLNFGQYSGKTLPHILLTDPDYFFWAHGEDVFKGQLASEAEVQNPDKKESGTPPIARKCPIRLVGRQGLEPWTR